MRTSRLAWLRVLFCRNPFKILNPPGGRRRDRLRAQPSVQMLEDHTLLSFAPPVTYPTGVRSEVAVAADLRGDNITDLVVTNNGLQDPGSVSVLLGNGDGTFQPARNLNVGFRPWGVAIGDFNGDGIPDLAVTHASTILPDQNTVTILLGNGDGTFRPAGDYQVGADPFSIAVADLRNNGTLDLVTGNQGGGTFTGSVSVLLGNGDGTFQNAVSLPGLPAHFAPNSVVVGDLRGNGIPDIVTAGNGTDVLVFLGNGDGTFQPPVRYDITGPFELARWVALGDFNGDGIPDLVTANLLNVNFEYHASVSVFLGNGDGTFADAVTYPLADASSADDLRNDVSVAVGDFSGTNQEDLIVSATANGSSADGLYQLVGNGDGTFQAPVQMRTVGFPKVAATGDFNGDGLLDLAVPSVVNQNVSVLLNNTGHGAPGTVRKGPVPRTSAGSHARAATLAAIFSEAHPETASRLVVDQRPTVAAVDAAFLGQDLQTVTPLREQPLVADTGTVVHRHKPRSHRASTSVSASDWGVNEFELGMSLLPKF